MQIGSTTASSGPVAPTQDRAALEKAAKAFEAIFLRQMIGAMRSASLGEGITDSGATEQFRDMSDAKTAEAMAEGSSMGIADLLLRQLGPRVTPLTPAKTGSAR